MMIEYGEQLYVIELYMKCRILMYNTVRGSDMM